MAPRVRLELTTFRLTAERSTDRANEEYLFIVSQFFCIIYNNMHNCKYLFQKIYFIYITIFSIKYIIRNLNKSIANIKIESVL